MTGGVEVLDLRDHDVVAERAGAGEMGLEVLGELLEQAPDDPLLLLSEEAAVRVRHRGERPLQHADVDGVTLSFLDDLERLGDAGRSELARWTLPARLHGQEA